MLVLRSARRATSTCVTHTSNVCTTFGYGSVAVLTRNGNIHRGQAHRPSLCECVPTDCSIKEVASLYQVRTGRVSLLSSWSSWSASSAPESSGSSRKGHPSPIGMVSFRVSVFSLDTWGICTRRAGKLWRARSRLYRQLR